MSKRTISAGAALGGIAVSAAALLLPSAAHAATPTSTPTPQAAACDRAPWGARVQGAPADFAGGDRGGDYLWHDGTGFHLRVTHRNDNRVVYTGVITSATAMRIDPVRLEPGDVARLSADHRSLVFAFADYGHVDGVDFHTDCSPTVAVSNLNAGNAKLPADRVYLGAKKVHPSQVPFVIRRHDTA